MEESDLRIGNTIEAYLAPPVSEWIEHTVIVETLQLIQENPNHGFRPIPITEDWFRKLSEEEFEFIGFGTRLIWQHKIYKSIKYECIANGRCAVYFNDEMINLKLYVHEWQNIHHALTGQELKLK